MVPLCKFYQLTLQLDELLLECARECVCACHVLDVYPKFTFDLSPLVRPLSRTFRGLGLAPFALLHPCLGHEVSDILLQVVDASAHLIE